MNPAGRSSRYGCGVRGGRAPGEEHPMRTLVVTVITSLDGFVAGPGGDVMAMPFDEGFDAYAAERMRAAGTLLVGRTTFEEFRSY